MTPDPETEIQSFTLLLLAQTHCNMVAKFQIIWSHVTSYNPCPQHGFYGVMVSTLDFESSDPSSNLGRTSCIDSVAQR